VVAAGARSQWKRSLLPVTVGNRCKLNSGVPFKFSPCRPGPGPRTVRPAYRLTIRCAAVVNRFFYVFDCLMLNGRDLRGLLLVERKEILQGIVKDHPRILYARHVDRNGCDLFRVAKRKNDSSGG
jgi:hypothetical protein